MTESYFIAKARSAFAQAGGDPDVTAELAAHAQSMREREATTEGVLVGRDGTLYATTRRSTSQTRANAAYVTDPLYPAAEPTQGLVVDMAAAQIRRAAGQPVIHLTYTDLCVGAGEFAVIQSPAIAPITRAATRLEQARQEVAAAQAERDEAMRAAHAAGERPGDIAAAARVRPAMYSRIIAGKQK